MRAPHRFLSYGLIAGMVMLAACQPAAVATWPSTESTASPNVTEKVSPTTSPSLPASPSTTPPTSSAPFACEPLDIRREADRTHALITDVRVGSHAGYDRVVFEFAQAPEAPPGIPEYVLQHAEPPLAQDPSGMPMDVAGERHVQLAILGGTKFDEDYNLTYGGPTEFDPGFPALLALYEAGDFEATATWYLGLHRDPCLRAFTLSDPHRLVIDIAH